MIKLIIGIAPEYIEIDDQKLDSWESLAARMVLRGRVDAWNTSNDAKNYPKIEIERDFESEMIAYIPFNTAEEAAIFRLTYPELCQS